MEKKAVVFAGTSEGRKIGQLLAKNGVSVHLCLATEYGGSLIEKDENLHLHIGRLEALEMEGLLKELLPEIVVDATHPYASQVTENVRNVCQKLNLPYLRMARAESEKRDAIYLSSTEEAVDFLNKTSGNVLLTTGSKELSAFVGVEDYENRLYARVLSLPSVVESCHKLGFRGKHLICMQGPFSTALNKAMMEEVGADYLVTKESGNAGGFEEKYQAVVELKKKMIIIGRPFEEDGLSYEECIKSLEERFNFRAKQEIRLVGIGMGDGGSLTKAGREAIEEADLLLGARRMVEGIKSAGQEVFISYNAKEIADYIKGHPQYEKIAIVLSGDLGFYSGAKSLLRELKDEAELIPGIASPVYFASRLKMPWQDFYLTSLHGKETSIISHIQRHEKVFALVGEEDRIGKVCRELYDYGMGDIAVSIGENLSYENEKISRDFAQNLVDCKTESLSVVLFENPKAKDFISYGSIADEEFLRDKVPMTKAEIRSLSLAKLRLSKDALVYDVGAGSGSVSIEMAKVVEEGLVYAIEKNELALELMEKNRKKFACDNMEIVSGLAPEVMEVLPAPSHVFIGGSSGNLKEIIACILKKNQKVRVVMNAITLETVAEAMDCLKIFDVEDVDIVAVSVGKSKSVGRYHMMMGQNPVYIISFQGR